MNLPEPPDFEAMLELASKLGDLKGQIELKKNTIATIEAQTVLTVMNDIRYYKNGKAPAYNMVEATYKYTGLNNELIPLRAELAELEGAYEASDRKFRTMQGQIQIFQTQSSNLRNSVL